VCDEDTIRRLAAAIPVPLNLVAGLASHSIDVPTLFSLGVRRVSLGGSLARVAFTALERAAQDVLDSGSLDAITDSIPYRGMQERFA
jgi:2-methylisocitrate lyase-like PEP mutase family enzyme